MLTGGSGSAGSAGSAGSLGQTQRCLGPGPRRLLQTWAVFNLQQHQSEAAAPDRLQGRSNASLTSTSMLLLLLSSLLLDSLGWLGVLLKLSHPETADKHQVNFETVEQLSALLSRVRIEVHIMGCAGLKNLGAVV